MSHWSDSKFREEPTHARTHGNHQCCWWLPSSLKASHPVSQWEKQNFGSFVFPAWTPFVSFHFISSLPLFLPPPSPSPSPRMLLLLDLSTFQMAGSHAALLPV